MLDLDALPVILQPLLLLQRMLCASPAWQRRVEAGNAIEAATHVDLFCAEEDDPAELVGKRPFAAIWPVSRRTAARYTGDGGMLDGSGSLMLRLTDRNRFPGRDPSNRHDSAVDFGVLYCQVWSEIFALSGQDDHLIVKNIDLAEDGGPWRCPTKDEAANGGGYWWVDLLVQY